MFNNLRARLGYLHGLDLLQVVADNTRKIKPRDFNMDSWKCGTTCCALGDAVNKRLVPSLTLFLPEVLKRNLPKNEQAFQIKHLPSGTEAMLAAAQAFDIAEREADFLFGADSYWENVKPEEVADRIDALIKEKRKDEQ